VITSVTQGEGMLVEHRCGRPFSGESAEAANGHPQENRRNPKRSRGADHKGFVLRNEHGPRGKHIRLIQLTTGMFRTSSEHSFMSCSSARNTSRRRSSESRK